MHFFKTFKSFNNRKKIDNSFLFINLKIFKLIWKSYRKNNFNSKIFLKSKQNKKNNIQFKIKKYFKVILMANLKLVNLSMMKGKRVKFNNKEKKVKIN